jgi:hypothetical protein
MQNNVVVVIVVMVLLIHHTLEAAGPRWVPLQKNENPPSSISLHLPPRCLVAASLVRLFIVVGPARLFAVALLMSAAAAGWLS